MLDEKTRSVALIRRKYPEMSLNELAQVYYEETGTKLLVNQGCIIALKN